MKNKVSDFILPINSTLKDTAYFIAKNKSRCILIVKENRVMGIVSEGDLLRALIKSKDIYTPVNDFINVSFEFLTEHNLAKAWQLVLTKQITMVPVLSQDFRVESIITLNDVYTWLSSQSQ